jgi:hypothetical protein
MDRLAEKAFMRHQPAIALLQHIATYGCAAMIMDMKAAKESPPLSRPCVFSAAAFREPIKR